MNGNPSSNESLNILEPSTKPLPYDLTQGQFESHRTERVKAICAAISAMAQQEQAFDPQSDYGISEPLMQTLVKELLRQLTIEFHPRI